MYPHSSPIYYKTRPRFYSGAISLKKLKNIQTFTVPIERVRIGKHGVAEYMNITFNQKYKRYSIRVIRDSTTYEIGTSSAKLWDIIIWLNEHDWMVGL